MRVERASHDRTGTTPGRRDRTGTGYLVPSKKPGRIERSSHAALFPMAPSFLPSPLASQVDISKFQALSNAEGPVGRMKRENKNTARRSIFGLPSAFGGVKSPPFGGDFSAISPPTRHVSCEHAIPLLCYERKRTRLGFNGADSLTQRRDPEPTAGGKIPNSPRERFRWGDEPTGMPPDGTGMAVRQGERFG